MIWKYKHGNVLIMDLEAPNQSEAKYIEEEYQIPEYFSKKIIIKDYLPIFENKEGYIFTSLNIPTLNGDSKISFISGDNILIISHNKKIDPILKYYQDLEIDLSLNKIDVENVNSDKIMINLIAKIFDHKIKYLDKIKFILKNNTESESRPFSDITDFLNRYESSIYFNKNILKELKEVIVMDELTQISSSINKLEEEIKAYKKINALVNKYEFEKRAKRENKIQNYAIVVLLVSIIMLIYLIWL